MPEMPSAAFETVVCTFSLCGIPDHRKALTEMSRVLRPGGVLLLADHVASLGWRCESASVSPSW
ncbi:MAG: class I SAM-dependent methyltransferase [Pseudonocardiaceae bacterium]